MSIGRRRITEEYTAFSDTLAAVLAVGCDEVSTGDGLIDAVGIILRRVIEAYTGFSDLGSDCSGNVETIGSVCNLFDEGLTGRRRITEA